MSEAFFDGSEVLAAVEGSRPNAKGWARGNCPFCDWRRGTADRSKCLGVQASTGKWHCFRCRAGGMLHSEELSELIDDLLVDVEEDETDEEACVPHRLPPHYVPLFEAPGWGNPRYARARKYARGRVSDQIGIDAGLGACLEGRVANRVVIPVYDVVGGVDGWAARDFTGFSTLRYMTPEGWTRSMHNVQALIEDSPDPVFAVEGGFDSLALWPDGVGFLGKPSPEQVVELASTERPVVCALDGDAWRECEALAMQLRALGHNSVGWVRLPPKVDPAKLGDALRAAAPSALKHGRAIIEG